MAKHSENIPSLSKLPAEKLSGIWTLKCQPVLVEGLVCKRVLQISIFPSSKEVNDQKLLSF